jgi:hypothetical protein
MRTGIGQPNYNDFWLPLKKDRVLGRNKAFSLLRRLQSAYPFSKSSKEVFSLQGAWYYSNTLPSILHGQNFRTIIRQPHWQCQCSPYPTPGTALSSSASLILHQYPERGLGLWCLTQLATIFQLYHGGWCPERKCVAMFWLSIYKTYAINTLNNKVCLISDFEVSTFRIS